MNDERGDRATEQGIAFTTLDRKIVLVFHSRPPVLTYDKAETMIRHEQKPRPPEERERLAQILDTAFPIASEGSFTSLLQSLDVHGEKSFGNDGRRRT